MEEHQLQDIQYAQRERLAYIDYCLQYFGKVSRRSLVRHFNAGLASCSRDFKLYSSLANKNLKLSHADKEYYRTESFKPLFYHDLTSVLTSLEKGFGSNVSNVEKGADWILNTSMPINIDLEIFSALTRSITLKSPIKIEYQSLNIGAKSCIVVPHSIYNNGFHWCIRAYDRMSERFDYLVCSRIESINILESSVRQHETINADEEWQHQVVLRLVPHPRLQYKKPIELDYQMINGQLALSLRSSLVKSLIEYWNVDYSKNAISNEKNCYLWLENSNEFEDLID